MTHHSDTGDTPNGDPTTDTTDHALRALDRLVGTWQVSREASGTISYAWMDGGFFLVQTGELDVFGHHNQFTEIIGRDKPFGGDPSDDIKSRVYTSAGDTLDYVYELTGDTLTIWGGHRDSRPAVARGNRQSARPAAAARTARTSPDRPAEDGWPAPRVDGARARPGPVTRSGSSRPRTAGSTRTAPAPRPRR